jgi:nucleotide-binding universal stress UspA family protein
LNTPKTDATAEKEGRMTISAPRILLAYDGSECADVALEDLQWAGLPDRADALIYSVSEVWLPTSQFVDTVEQTFPEWFTPEMDSARVLAEDAARRLRDRFPGWSVDVDVELGSAALRILRKAESWRANLIVTGARGRSATGALVLGSISQTVCVEAPCSVRVGRGGRDPEAPVRIAVGVDGSECADAAVEAVAQRTWSDDVEVLLLTALTSSGLPNDAAESARARVRELQERAEERLRSAGLRVSSATAEGNPRIVIVDEVERWGATSVFLGTRGASHFARSPLGSVSAAVVARARCSVEVVRGT